LKYLHNFKIHPQFSFPFREKFIHTDFDLSSGWRAKKVDLNEVFFQLISEKKLSVEELDIYTDGSKSPVEQSENMVGCAIFIF